MLLRQSTVALILLFGVPFAFGEELPVDINGFRLWQYRNSAENYFGKPFQKMEQGDSVLEAHKVNGHSYMVFEYWKEFPQNAVTIQITGYPTKMTPFKGLTLGDSEALMRTALGEPTGQKMISNPPVTIYYYHNANYTTEVDQQGRLYSIKLLLKKEMMNNADKDFAHWTAFKKALLAKDEEAIFQWLRPDVEIFKAGKTLSIDRRYADFKSSPNKEFMNALIGEQNSVRSQLQTTEPDQEMRLLVGMGAGFVYKFYNDKILAEIVFFPYNGQFRIYEIAFRGDEK